MPLKPLPASNQSFGSNPFAIPLFIEALEERRLLSVNVLSYHGDTASTGLNSSEVQLTPTNVKVQSFGKLFATELDGQVYAEPLVDTGVTITDGVNTMPNAAGVHDVVFVATENDTLYAIDTSVTHGAILWERSFLPASNPGAGSGVLGDQNNTLSATTIVAVPNDDTGTTDLSPVVGITSTPVIDPVTHLLYVLVKTKETIGGVAHYVQRLHAINISDGTDATAPFLVGDTFNGNTNNTPIYSYGTGDGSVTDPYNGTGDPVVQFNALRENQRDALNLVDGTVYVTWASHGDNGPYHGWVVAWDVSQVSTNGLELKGVLDTSPNDGESGIWGGGGQLAFEPDGSAFYFMTGNGSGGAPPSDRTDFRPMATTTRRSSKPNSTRLLLPPIRTRMDGESRSSIISSRTTLSRWTQSTPTLGQARRCCCRIRQVSRVIRTC